ncbi:MAG: hypothetical protein HY738_04685 [Bacteroidia bacterium]|nr:hypothetical protein [Bacteroidia bacterium]
MKIQILTLLSIFGIITLIKGQSVDYHNYSALNNIEPKQSVAGGFYNGYAGSTGLNNKFMYSLYKGDYISTEMKESNKLKNNNYVGLLQDISLFYACLSDSLFGIDSLGIRVGLYDHFHEDARFSDELYNLIFYRNNMYAGQTVDFSNTIYNCIRYQELQLGLFKQQESPDGKTTYYAGLSLIKGQKFNYLYIKEGSLFTEENGAYLDFNVKGIYFSSDSAKKKISDFNGIGGTLNFYIDYLNKVHKYNVNISINHLGYIQWNKKTMIVPVDTTFHYEDMVMEHIIDIDSVNTLQLGEDTLRSRYMELAKYDNYSGVLPERMNISFGKQFLNDKLNATLGVCALFNSNARLPVIYGQIRYSVLEKLNASLHIAYGGYSNFQTGIILEAAFSDWGHILLGTENLPGFIAPEYTYNASIFGGFHIIF